MELKLNSQDLIVCSVYLSVKAFSNIKLSSEGTVTAKLVDLLSGTNGVLLAALAGTFGEPHSILDSVLLTLCRYIRVWLIVGLFFADHCSSIDSS